MKIPKVHGLIKRRLLVNYRADPAVVQKLLPPPFKPKLQGQYAMVGICLIRLEQIRMAGIPGLFGISSENAAHRMAIEWVDENGKPREGVYIPRRDTSSWLNRLIGGRLFPGVHHGADFSIVDTGAHIDFNMRSHDHAANIQILGKESDAFPGGSCFRSLQESSAFFQRGSLGYSASHDPRRLDALELHTTGWTVSALDVENVTSSYFENRQIFPSGSIEYDHTLLMRNLKHEWHQGECMCIHPK